MFAALDISTSALSAQRMRLNVIASNMANLSSQRNENGEIAPYQAKFPIFSTDSTVAGGDKRGDGAGPVGVKVASIETETKEPLYRYQPNHPLAIKDGPKQGYVAYPNVDMTREMVDAMEATRAYEANVGVMEMTKSMARQTLRILG